MDRRRQRRIQGGWADNRPSQAERRQKYTSPSKHTSSLADTSENHDTTVPAHKGVDRKYVFQDQAATLVKPHPAHERIITTGGTYELSNTPANGVSRVEFYPDFLPSKDAEWMFDHLKQEVPWEEKYIKLKGEFHRQPRLTAWYGDFPYTYSGLTLQPFQWSPLLNILKDRIKEKTGEVFNSMLANLYRDCKDSVDWHADDEASLGEYPTIASLSFGDTRNFEMKPKEQQGQVDVHSVSAPNIKVPLPSGSLLIMRDAVQKDWQHRVPKEYHDRGPRINLTFRNIMPEKS